MPWFGRFEWFSRFIYAYGIKPVTVTMATSTSKGCTALAAVDICQCMLRWYTFLLLLTHNLGHKQHQQQQQQPQQGRSAASYLEGFQFTVFVTLAAASATSAASAQPGPPGSLGNNTLPVPILWLWPFLEELCERLPIGSVYFTSDSDSHGDSDSSNAVYRRISISRFDGTRIPVAYTHYHYAEWLLNVREMDADSDTTRRHHALYINLNGVLGMDVNVATTPLYMLLRSSAAIKLDVRDMNRTYINEVMRVIDTSDQISLVKSSADLISDYLTDTQVSSSDNPKLVNHSITAIFVDIVHSPLSIIPRSASILNKDCHSHLTATEGVVQRYHSSSGCNLWWPLNGTEIHIFGSNVLTDLLTSDIAIIDCSSRFNFAVHTTYTLTISTSSLNFYSWKVLVDKDGIISVPFPLAINPNDIAKGRILLTIALVDEDRPSEASIFSIVRRFVSNHGSQSNPGDAFPVTMQSQLPAMVNEIRSRDEFGYFLSDLMESAKVPCSMVEVGVNEGHFALQVLSTWQDCDHYILVDPWLPVVSNPSDYIDLNNRVLETQKYDQNYRATVERLSSAGFDHKCSIMRMTSAQAALRTANESIGVVYIDARHDYVSVLEDIESWWPKVAAGGVLAGHDFFLGYDYNTIFTVKPAVEKWARDHHRVLYHTNDATLPTWFLFK